MAAGELFKAFEGEYLPASLKTPGVCRPWPGHQLRQISGTGMGSSFQLGCGSHTVGGGEGATELRQHMERLGHHALRAASISRLLAPKFSVVSGGTG